MPTLLATASRRPPPALLHQSAPLKCATHFSATQKYADTIRRYRSARYAVVTQILRVDDGDISSFVILHAAEKSLAPRGSSLA
jgi:hypothetical protein